MTATFIWVEMLCSISYGNTGIKEKYFIHLFSKFLGHNDPEFLLERDTDFSGTVRWREKWGRSMERTTLGRKKRGGS